MDAVAVNVQIMGKDYRISCPQSERDALVASANYLNEKMREVADKGKLIGGERVAVMAALNIAHEYLQLQTEQQERSEAVRIKLQGLRERIGVAMDDQAQIQMW